MTTVLVTGGGERLDEVSSAVKATGADVVVVDDLGPSRGERGGGRPSTRYVQLPVAMTPGEGSLVAKVEQFLTQGMLSRFRAAATVLPTLASEATVMLVGGQTKSTPTPPTTPRPAPRCCGSSPTPCAPSGRPSG